MIQWYEVHFQDNFHIKELRFAEDQVRLHEDYFLLLQRRQSTRNEPVGPEPCRLRSRLSLETQERNSCFWGHGKEMSLEAEGRRTEWRTERIDVTNTCSQPCNANMTRTCKMWTYCILRNVVTWVLKRKVIHKKDIRNSTSLFTFACRVTPRTLDALETKQLDSKRLKTRKRWQLMTTLFQQLPAKAPHPLPGHPELHRSQSHDKKKY